MCVCIIHTVINYVFYNTTLPHIIIKTLRNIDPPSPILARGLGFLFSSKRVIIVFAGTSGMLQKLANGSAQRAIHLVEQIILA